MRRKANVVVGFFFLILSSFGLLGCASELVRKPIQINESSDDLKQIVIVEDVKVEYSSGFTRTIKKGSKWRFVGSTNMGNVFKPIGTVFTVEGAHVREAYLVIAKDQLNGFYIPGEDSFSPQIPPIPLSIREDR